MLDIKFIRENKDLIAMAAKKKHLDFAVDELIAADDKRRALLSSIEKNRALQNSASDKITLQGARYPEHLQKLIGR